MIVNPIYKLFLIIFFSVSAYGYASFPVSYQGRIRPSDTYAHNLVVILYQNNDISSINLSSLDFLFSLVKEGHHRWDSAPLFGIKDKELQSLFGSDRVSLLTIKEKLYHDPSSNQKLFVPLLCYLFTKQFLEPQNFSHSQRLEITFAPGLWIEFDKDKIVIVSLPSSYLWKHFTVGQILGEGSPATASQISFRLKSRSEELLALIGATQRIEQMAPPGETVLEKNWKKAYQSLKGLPPSELAVKLESQFPLVERLKNTSPLFRALPGKYSQQEWFPISALALQVYNVDENKLTLIPNFTRYPDELFHEIQKAFLESRYQDLTNYLNEGYYTLLAGKPIQKGAETNLYYPTFFQLYAEKVYTSFPIILVLAVGYTLSFFLLLFCRNVGIAAYIILLSLHTAAFIIRWAILHRPPVSNMAETILYVPWLAGCASLFLTRYIRQIYPMLASALLSALLLATLYFTHTTDHLENVQAVLDSRFWLIVHVLMVVGSYGMLLLAGILGHFYLLHPERPSILASLILKCILIGVIMLIPGTILGGVWAAQSWGRFWDWDPKESWAFISSCVYLLIIHAYRFKYIHDFGLAMGSIIGLLAISFTWYGVNYILGTGLHSYGFGSGGEYFYYLFLLFESMLLIIFGKYNLRKTLKYIKIPKTVEKT